MTTTSLILFVLLAQAAPAAPPAQDKAKAKSLLGEGTSLYEKGDYTGALDKFHAAYAAYSSPKIWFNIGQANRDLGRPVEALDAFQKFLDGAPDAAPEDKADAQASVAELQKRLGQLTIVCETAGAEINIDGRVLGPAPLAKPIWATPGWHQVTALQKGAAPAVEGVEVKAGTSTTVVLRPAQLGAPPLAVGAQTANLALPATAGGQVSDGLATEPPAAAASGRPFYKTWWFWTAVGGAVAAGTVTAFVLGSGSKSACSGEAATCVGVK